MYTRTFTHTRIVFLIFLNIEWNLSPHMYKNYRQVCNVCYDAMLLYVLVWSGMVCTRTTYYEIYKYFQWRSIVYFPIWSHLQLTLSDVRMLSITASFTHLPACRRPRRPRRREWTASSLLEG